MLEPRFAPARWRRVAVLILASLLAFALTACAVSTGGSPAGITEVVLASTTSTEDSGLFSALIPAFEDAYSEYRVSVVAVGTGQALEIGRAGDADVLLVHAKADEERFVADGYGTERRDVMHNDFVVVGPPADPAGIGGGNDAAAAFARIAAGQYTFASRGDDSGTHKKELEVWEAAGIEPAGDWYNSIGQGMGETLVFASEVEGYTLADRGTFLSMRDRLELEVLVQGDPLLNNPYGVIVVNDASNPDGARAFADWIVSAKAQDIIREFGVKTYGEPLFVPNAE